MLSATGAWLLRVGTVLLAKRIDAGNTNLVWCSGSRWRRAAAVVEEKAAEVVGCGSEGEGGSAKERGNGVEWWW